MDIHYTLECFSNSLSFARNESRLKKDERARKQGKKAASLASFLMIFILKYMLNISYFLVLSDDKFMRTESIAPYTELCRAPLYHSDHHQFDLFIVSPCSMD